MRILNSEFGIRNPSSASSVFHSAFRIPHSAFEGGQAPPFWGEMHYVYLLQSLARDFTYVGCTSNLSKRYDEHQAGVVQSTRVYRPLRLVYYEAYQAQQDAINREKRLKHHGSVIGHLKKRAQHSLACPKRAGQALVELAVFGSLLLFLIGYLVNNALQLDYRQQATMEAFRRGLASAAAAPPGLDDTPSSTSHLLIQDRQIPEPSDPFALGGVSPVTAQASITRTYELGLRFPRTARELPRLAVQIEHTTTCPSGTAVPGDDSGNPKTCYYTTAGLREEFGVRQSSVERYRFIYGASNVCDEEHCGGGDAGCLVEETLEENRMTGELEPVCLEPLKRVQIVDGCMGEILGLDDCVKQAAQINDDAACDAACQRAAASGTKNLDCARMCSQPMAVIPWYASGAGCGGGACTAPVLAGLFEGITTLGVQPGSTQTVVVDNRLNKQESPGGVTTTSTVDTTETTDRTVIRVSGQSAATDTITAERTEQHTTSMSAPW